MAGLNNIPVELFIQIAADLDESSFLKLCRCCRILNSLATPCVYHRVRLHSIWALRRFTLTVSENPMLGLLVKCFELHRDLSPLDNGSPATDNHEIDRRETIDHRMLHAMRSRSSLIGQGRQRTQDLAKLESINLGTLLELLYPVLSNVEHIDTLPDTIMNWLPVRWMRRKKPIFKLQKYFPYLTSIGRLVERIPGKAIRGFRLTEAEILLRIPTLRSFAACVRSLDESECSEAHLAWLSRLGPSNVTHLELRSIDHRSDSVARLIDCCEKLKTFIIEWWEYDDSFHHSSIDVVEPYIAALYNFNTLENLSLNYGSSNDHPDGHQLKHLCQPIGAFTSWQRLKHLRLNASYFLQFHKHLKYRDPQDDTSDDFVYRHLTYTDHLRRVLPPNISKLSLKCNADSRHFIPYMLCLEKLLPTIRETHPLLAVIVLEFRCQGCGNAPCGSMYCPC